MTAGFGTLTRSQKITLTDDLRRSEAVASADPKQADVQYDWGGWFDDVGHCSFDWLASGTAAGPWITACFSSVVFSYFSGPEADR